MKKKYIKIISGLIMLLFAFYSVKAQPPTPGGVSGSNYVWAAWLTPDGYVKNGNNGTWQNNFTGTGSIGNFTSQTTTRIPYIDENAGRSFNFHPSVRFDKASDDDASNRLRSSATFDVNSKNLTVIFVLKYNPSTGYDDLISFNTSGGMNLTNIIWWNGQTANMRWHWNGDGNPTTTALSTQQGILTFDNANGGALKTWIDGTGGPAGLTRNYRGINQNVTLSANGSNGYGFRGNIQEMIIFNSGANGNNTPVSDLQKIHSYLAVKYGFTLGTSIDGGDYVNSDGTVIWDRKGTVNNGYQNNIFGIARDNASRLNQVQSRSNDSDVLTLYKGYLNTYNNNNSDELTDKTAIMLGSNNLSINASVIYRHPEGTEFENGVADIRLNFRTSLIYKAQVTTNGVQGGNQTVNILVNCDRARYVLVSDNASFPTGSNGGTCIYEITNRTASILVKDGDYITFAGFEALPGGVLGYNLDLWVDGDHSTNNSWNSLAITAYNLEKGSPVAPIVRNSKFNFHKEIYFGNTDRSKLYTTVPYRITTGEAYHSFVVSENTETGERTLIAFNPTNNDANGRRAALQWNGVAQARGSWGGAIASAAAQKFGITSMSARNTSAASGNGNLYMNAVSTNLAVTQFTNTAERLVIANGSRDNTTATAGNRLPFNGSIQEVIVMRGGATVMPANDVARIHSYLAIKYGITLAAGDYLNSDGNVVWSRSANAGYTNNIFGIARDYESGLYQKQSKSTSFPYLTMFINGSELKTLNAENTGTFEDKQYFIAGSNGGTALQSISTPIQPNTEYENGSIDEDMIPLNIKTPTYKAQWSGFANDSVRITMQAQEDFYYAQVSIDDSFTPANTKIYPVSHKMAEVDFAGEYKYFRFVGFAPGPGGVIPNLQLWLRADDEASITIENLPAGNGGDAKVAGYPDLKSGETELPAVSEWKDLVRQHTYSYAAANTPHLMPVLKYNSPEMNYHPAVRFWTNSSNNDANTAYLTNLSGILNVARPEGHTAIFVINANNFNGNPPRSFMFLFSNPAAIGNFNGPGYAIENVNNRIVGRFLTDGDEYNGSLDLFSFGATSILDYFQKNNRISFRFNGKEDSPNRNLNWGNFNMSSPSKIGTGYNYVRTVQGVISEAIIYDKALSIDERRKVESYLALKYGVTLHPDNTATKRFDYTLSDGTVLWKGDAAESDFLYGKFAKYYNRVAAIIRDDIARLNNRHSHSTNVGSLLHLGIAGTALGEDGSTIGYWEHNMEAVAFGDNDSTGFSPRNSNCSNFDYRFNRIWLIHKMTEDNHPVSLLVGAQNNKALSIGGNINGNTNNTKDYYDKLVPSNDICLIVGNSPEDIENGNYTAIIPMVMINGEYQCNYEFTEEDTYITFGYKANNKGCYSPENAQFEGSKTFRWTQYTTQTNRTNNAGLTISAGEVDLGDSIIVTGTKLVYPPNVRALRSYPRAINAPSRGSLEVRRTGGTAGQDIVISIDFKNAVMPSFSISGIDGTINSYDEVSISGTCSGNTYYPRLTPAGRMPSYKINGNTVTANRRVLLSPNDRNGMVNVAFEGAIEHIEIRYRLKNRVISEKRIYISPITLRATTPPPPINEDGIGFAKYASDIELTTCEALTYTFLLVNANCDDKYVNFTDELNPNMKWEIESLVLDTMNNFHNSFLKINKYGETGKLEIDSLLIPGTSEINIKATAVFNENAPGGEYKNNANIKYYRYTYLLGELIGTEEITANSEASVNVEQQEYQEPLTIEVISNPTYKENSELEITYKINNPNSAIDSMFMDVDFNDGFYYVNNSFRYYTDDSEAESLPTDPVFVTDGAEPNANYLSLAGAADGSVGFTLPSGISYITFKIKTPSSVQDELDENGQPTGNKEPLFISHSFLSEMEDTCLIKSMEGLDGTKTIRFFKEKKHIITNRNKTAKIK